MTNVTFVSNTEVTATGNGLGAGGAISGAAALKLRWDHSVFSTNSVKGGDGSSGMFAGNGGDGLGGAIYTLGDSLTVTNTTFVSNSVIGGRGGSSNTTGGGFGGAGNGGALYTGATTSVTVTNSTFSSNIATGTPEGVSCKGLYL